MILVTGVIVVPLATVISLMAMILLSARGIVSMMRGAMAAMLSALVVGRLFIILCSLPGIFTH
jgi:hypothetical protein